MPYRSPSLLLACLLPCALLLGACDGCGIGAALEDAGLELTDGGINVRRDAGFIDAGDGEFIPPWPDAGIPFKTGGADVPCPEGADEAAVAHAASTEGLADGGFPEGMVKRGLCIGLAQLSGNAYVDGLPPTAPIHFTADDLNHQSGLEITAAPDGRYALRFMQSRYDRLLFHPRQLGLHSGPKDFGFADLRKDFVRNVSVKTVQVGGSAFFAGQPWPSSQQPPDITLHAEGLPSQTAMTANALGAWSVRLMEGEYQLRMSVPHQSLGETQLLRYPIAPWTLFNGDRTIDVDIPAAELSGHFTFDGEAFPDRLPNGPEYRLEFTPSTGGDPVASTQHGAGDSFYAALVPRGLYRVSMTLLDAVDARWPSTILGKQIASSVDLQQGNAQLSVDFPTHALEGVLMIDGEAVEPKPTSTWLLYAQASPIGTDPGFLAYYHVPLAHPGFNLRALRGTYMLAVLTDGSLHPELAQGWHIFERQRLVDRDLSIPIDIQTDVVEGLLRIDGVPAKSELGIVGRLSFRSQNTGQRFTSELQTTDGHFRVRLPRDVYDVEFEIDPEAYPQHAYGRHPLGAVADLTEVRTEPLHLNLDYRTVAVGGAFLVGNELLPDAHPGQPEARLHLRRGGSSNLRYQKRLEGGRNWWFMRVPEGDYTLSFELHEGVFEDVAFGTAGIANGLKAK